MVYKKKEDKKQIERAFTMLLAEFGTTIKKFCRENDFSYSKAYQQIKGVNHCDHDFINEMVAKLDQKRSLQRINNRLVIARKF
jgi:predicted transcriptional regulator